MRINGAILIVMILMIKMLTIIALTYNKKLLY